MGEVQKIFLTSGLTVLGAVLVFTVGQLLSRFVVEPVLKLRSLLGDVAHVLIVHDEAYRMKARFASSPQDAMDAAKTELLRKAGDLYAQGYLILWWEPFVNLGWIPARQKVLDASLLLIQIANSVHTTQEGNYERSLKVRETLNLPPRP